MSNLRGINRWHVLGWGLMLVARLEPVSAQPVDLIKAQNDALLHCATELYGGNEPQPGEAIRSDSYWKPWHDCQFKSMPRDSEVTRDVIRQADDPNAVLTKRLLLIGEELYGSGYKNGRAAASADTQIKDFLVQIHGSKILRSDERPQAVRSFLGERSQ